jgi:3-oxoacyl-[acyl-carrier protein] reductase
MLDLLIVTGASRGIGASIVKQCSSICKKMLVIASSDKVNSINLDDDCELIKLQLDLTNYNDVLEKVQAEVSKLGSISKLGIILCGAQIGEHGGLFSAELNDWENIYKCNVLGNLAVVKGCSDVIKSGAETKIAFFSGGGAAFGYPDFFGYALTKTAVVRSVENLALELSNAGYNASVIALAPGAVKTDMLDKVLAHGGSVLTRTDISEPTNFVFNFLTDKLPTKELNGKFLHVRDDLSSKDLSNKDIFKLRRIQ